MQAANWNQILLDVWEVRAFETGVSVTKYVTFPLQAVWIGLRQLIGTSIIVLMLRDRAV